MNKFTAGRTCWWYYLPQKFDLNENWSFFILRILTAIEWFKTNEQDKN